MPVTIDGNNIMITDATIEVVNGVNNESGVAYIIITPEGGVGAIPFMAQGLPGQPTLFPLISYVQHPDGEVLPSPNPVSTQIDPGAAGLPAKYSLEFHGNAGPAGITGSASFSGASDLATSPVLGALTDTFTFVYRSSDAKVVPTAQKVGSMSIQSAIVATAFNATSVRTLSSIAIPPQPFDWRPICFASTIIAGSVDTRVDLFAYLNTVGSGDQVGYAKGLTGANTAGVQTVMLPASPVGSSIPGAYGRVAANLGATIHLRAEQKAASSNSWSTPGSPDTTFSVVVQPLL